VRHIQEHSDKCKRELEAKFGEPFDVIKRTMRQCFSSPNGNPAVLKDEIDLIGVSEVAKAIRRSKAAANKLPYYDVSRWL